jgi:hypothetical protein
MWLVAPRRLFLVTISCGWLALLDATHEAANIGFWIIGHDDDPSLAIINRRTWLRDEPLVHIAVRAGVKAPSKLPPSVQPTRLTQLQVAFGATPPSGLGRSIDNTHSRDVSEVGAFHSRLSVVNVYLRSKLRAMLRAICEADEEFAVILDDDTAINTTCACRREATAQRSLSCDVIDSIGSLCVCNILHHRQLRSWLASSGHRAGWPLYAGAPANMGGRHLSQCVLTLSIRCLHVRRRNHPPHTAPTHHASPLAPTDPT